MSVEKTPADRPPNAAVNEQDGKSNPRICEVCGLAVAFGETCGRTETRDVPCCPGPMGASGAGRKAPTE